jgi:hypothetical protein
LPGTFAIVEGGAGLWLRVPRDRLTPVINGVTVGHGHWTAAAAASPLPD